MKVTDVLTPEEIKAFTRRSDARGWLAVATSWGMIAGAFALAALWTNALTIALALIILGGRQLALAILTHDCAHYSLFRTNRLNDFVGKWLCGAPVWLDLQRYRTHHLKHHQFAGSAQDPDEDLVRMYPATRGSLARKFLRDLSGITGLKRFYGLVLMDLGVIEFTVSSRVERVPREKLPRGRAAFALAARRIGPVLLTNAALAGLVTAATGSPFLWLLWPIAYVTTFSVILRIRSIAEHACTDPDLDPLRSTRTTLASPLARVTVAPHRVNFHLEHHLLMAAPYYLLPKLHATLRERGAHARAHVARDYLEVLRIATR